MGRPLEKSDCDELGAYIHKRNIVCSCNLLDALMVHHGAEPCSPEVIETVPEPIPEITNIAPVFITPNKIEHIKRLVCKQFGISKAIIESKSRKAGAVYPRQIVMYLARKHTTHSYPEIGRRLGGRDHTTILHAFHKIEGLILQDNDVAAEVALLEESIS